MQEIPFSIPVSGVIRINGSKVTIFVNHAETTVNIETPLDMRGRFSLEKGRTMYDILLETAQELVKGGQSSFSSSQLYEEALQKYPGLKKNSWTSHVIASAPNHPSYKHHSSRRDYLSYSGNGQYRLKPQYWLKET